MSDGAKLTFNLGFLNFPSAAERFFSASGPFRTEIMPEAHRLCMIRETDKSQCGTGTPDEEPDLDFARKYVDRAKVNRSVFSGIYRFGFEGSIGFDQFEYVETTSLGKTTTSELQASGAATFTYYPPDALSTLFLRGEYQNAYEEADQQRICKPVIADPATDCVQEAKPAPEHVEHFNLSVEYRRLFDLGFAAGMIGISPRATYDVLSDEFEAELPIYLVPENQGPIAPGISLTYSSKEDDVRFAAFLKFEL
jgi:hypothetical protein